MERDQYCIRHNTDSGHFNSHAHVERDGTYYTFNKTLAISTHTLTWSVTHCEIVILGVCHISTHTLTWSVTV